MSPNNNIKYKILFFALLLSVALSASLRLPALISDGMVLQRDAKVKVWGWANAADKVELIVAGKTYTTVANANGEWSIVLPKHKSGGPHAIEIRAHESIKLSDVYFGDVWLCSGQSNMELPMHRVKPLYEDEMRTANNPLIRCFTVPQRYDFKTERTDYEPAKWQLLNAETAPHFSAVAYFFAQKLFNEYRIPIGLINASLGGSPVQAWMSEEALRQFPTHLAEAHRWRSDDLVQATDAKNRQQMNDWYSKADALDMGSKMGFKNKDFNCSDWKAFSVPGYLSTGSKADNGVFWLRRTVNISKNEAGKTAFLEMGRIVDADSVFVNGHFVGNVTYQYPPRWYNVPANVLVEGENVIAVRLVSNAGHGGFVLDKKYELRLAQRTINLEGEWRMKQTASMPAMPGENFIRWKPMGLYNAMIAPMRNYALKGVIWYQGESNTSNPKEYAKLFPTMINDWRRTFAQPQLPFVFVQLANYMEAAPQPTESNWAETREAQQAALKIKNTAMAVAIDLGEWNDIHPLNKKDVGIRLALGAMRVAYNNKKVISAGPMFKKAKVKGNVFEIQFDNIANGLVAKGDTLNGFALAGADGIYYWVDAKIVGNKVLVSSTIVSNPVSVRYAWAHNPHNANLYNGAHLPAAPFQFKIK